jgi:hypothetical protein
MPLCPAKGGKKLQDRWMILNNNNIAIFYIILAFPHGSARTL